MKREILVEQAKAAGQAAEHNLRVIVKNPDRMISLEKYCDGVVYLNKMIWFAQEETKNAHRPGWTSLKSHLLKQLSLILNAVRRKSKGEIV
ncbi:hypothetical protein [Paenibacillus sp. HGF5]|uniref:hypothetical protein n=1 Tax=Paenibacillus sp. HGF5 TaxID=908341 RepID=UPI00020727BE|nr:hypothetical protein [Paenibacillus sp. HGF5]EGG33429.1 conserved domain protein [Paenibacillus sp. HGF5]